METDTLGLMTYLGKNHSWARGSRGWVPRDQRKKPQSMEEAKTKFKNVYLKDFMLGGVQTEFLKKLVRQIRRDGFTPVLYLLPVAESNRRLFTGEDYSKFLSHLRSVAHEENVQFADLDTGHQIDEELFEDSNHLKTEGARQLSPLFAEKVHLALRGSHDRK